RVEDPGTGLWGPAPVGLLSHSQPRRAAPDRVAPRVSGGRQGQQGPGRHHRMAAGALGIRATAAALQRLAPTAIRALPLMEEADCRFESRMLWTNARRDQAQNAEPGAVGEANAPGALPGSVASLGVDQKIAAALDRSGDPLPLPRLEARRRAPIAGQRLDTGGRALHIRIVDHNPRED